MDKTERLIKVINMAQTDLNKLLVSGYRQDEQIARLQAEIAALKAKLEANREAVH